MWTRMWHTKKKKKETCLYCVWQPHISYESTILTKNKKWNVSGENTILKTQGKYSLARFSIFTYLLGNITGELLTPITNKK